MVDVPGSRVYEDSDEKSLVGITLRVEDSAIIKGGSAALCVRQALSAVAVERRSCAFSPISQLPLHSLVSSTAEWLTRATTYLDPVYLAEIIRAALGNDVSEALD